MKSRTPDSCFREQTVARTLDTFSGSPECNQGGNVVAYSVDCRSMRLGEEISGTLQAKENGGYSLNYQNPVVYDARGNGDGKIVPTITGDHENRVTDYTAVCYEEVFPQVTGCLCANTHPGGVTGQDAFNDMLPVTPGKPPRKYLVRRLTPLECCRLQGFPDWWEAGVEGSDSARCKMWGNGMALPCVLYVMEGIVDEM